MSKQTQSPLPQDAEARLFRRSRRVVSAMLRPLLGWIERRSARTILAVGIGMVSVVSLGIALATVARLQFVPKFDPLADQALHALDEGDWELARKLAVDLRTAEESSDEGVAGGAFVLGTLAEHDAAGELEPSRQRGLYTLAVRYLEEARRRGLPEDRVPQAEFLLGKSLHSLGRYAEAQPVLRAALDLNPQSKTEIARLLAESYLRDPAGDVAQAVDLMEIYLADPLLSAEMRYAGWLEKAQLQWRLGNGNAARETLHRIPATAKVHAEAVVLEARSLIREADDTSPSSRNADETSADAKKNYQAAQEMLETLLASGQSSAAVRRQALYLLGLCALRFQEPSQAMARFQELTGVYPNSEEGLAAYLEQGDLLRQDGKPLEALTTYRRVLQRVDGDSSFRNPWFDYAELAGRLQGAVEAWSKQDQLMPALTLAQSLDGYLPDKERLRLTANLQMDLSRQRFSEAERALGRKREDLLGEARQFCRDAGRDFAQLAELSATEKNYPDLIWQSADLFRQGQDYPSAQEQLKVYLQTQPRATRTTALIALGETYLSVGNSDQALRYLTECLAENPQHPLSYRVRILISQARWERGQFDEAKTLLRENLDQAGLAPSSREWRDSLFAIGRILYREGRDLELQSRREGIDSPNEDSRRAAWKTLEQSAARLQEAVRSLREAIRRYPEDSQSLEARYLLGDSYRVLAQVPRRRMPLYPIAAAQDALKNQMAQELNLSLEAFRDLETILQRQQEQKEVSETDRRLLRNTLVMMADVLFDLEQFEEALAAYSLVTQRYQAEPVILEAYVQMASCLRRLGRRGEAVGILEQARGALQRLRKDADFVATTRYSRAEWAQVLDQLVQLYSV